MPHHLSSPILLATAIGILATAACRDSSSTRTPPDAKQGLEGFFNPQPGEVWTYAVTRDFAPGSKLRPIEEANASILPNGAKRVTFERRRVCAGLERPEGAEKDLTAFELHEEGLLVEREFYDITSAGLIGRGWTPAPEITPAVKPPPKGILLTPGVPIAVPHMVGGQSWSAPGIKSGPIFQLDIIERATVAVPAGEFEATRIRLTTGTPKRSTKRTVWFAENIGIVKEEVAHYGADRVLVKEHLVLTKWSLPSDTPEQPTVAKASDPGPPSEANTPPGEDEPAPPELENFGPPLSLPPDDTGSDGLPDGIATDAAPSGAPDQPEEEFPDEPGPPPFGQRHDGSGRNEPAPPRAEIIEE